MKIDCDGLSVSKILLKFLTYFNSLKLEKKLYILIDEYDNFTNAILEGNAERFMGILGNEGFVKDFYAVIKEYSGNTIGRVFITGICPITLNSMTTGFNIAKDISTDELFTSMIGLTHEEVKTAIDNIIETGNKNEIYDTMVKHYDGYLFSKEANERVFNATLVMYFLSYYVNHNNTIPNELYDNNIVVNYGKIDNLLKLQNNNFYKGIIEEVLKSDTVDGILKTQFNLAEDFTRDDIISLLYYFGYLTVKKEDVGNIINFVVPNEAMRVTYNNYFIKMMSDVNVRLDNSKTIESIKEIIEKGSINAVTYYVSELLNECSDIIFINFNEKDIQIMYYTILKNIKELSIRTEYECISGYVDLFIEGNTVYTPYNVMIELKYVKKGEKNIKKAIEERRLEGIEQLKRYKVDKDNLKKYLVVFVGRDVKFIEEFYSLIVISPSLMVEILYSKKLYF